MEIKYIEYKNWHPKFKLIHKNFNCVFTNNPGGCGSMILHHWSNSHNEPVEEIQEALEYVIDIIKNKKGIHDSLNHQRIDVGMIQTIVGQTYYNTNFVKAIRKVGFKRMSTYKNPRHGSNYTQRLYIWTI